MNLEKVIDEAYELYMPQDRYEITELAKFVKSRITDEPYNILEIGTKFGGTFHIWNNLNQTDGLNISIDYNDTGIHGGIANEVMDKRDETFKALFNNCKFIRGDSHSLETNLKLLEVKAQSGITLLNPEFKVEPFLDFLFIDGDHTYEGVKQDFLDYSKYCKNYSIIAFHDIVISDRHHSRNVYVGEFWADLKKSGKYEMIEFVEGNNDWAGIGVLLFKQC